MNRTEKEPGMWSFTEADVQRTMDALIAEGADDADPGLHASWRCFDKVRYPEPCTCIRQAAENILIAAVPAMRDRWRQELAAKMNSPEGRLELVRLTMSSVDESDSLLLAALIAADWVLARR